MSEFETFLNSLQGKDQRFSYQQRVEVWNEGQIVLGNDPSVFRKDACGAWMRWSDYGDTGSQYGWEVDHIYPKALGGGDALSNLQPLQWQNNRAKGDSLAKNYCSVEAAV